MNANELLQRYLFGEATRDEVTELNRLLAADPALRRRLIEAAEMDSALREVALERLVSPGSATPSEVARPVFRPVLWAVAASVAVMLSIWMGVRSAACLLLYGAVMPCPDP